MTLRTTLGEHLPTVVANNINMKIHQLFSEQRIVGVRASIAQRKILGDLTRT